MKKIILTGALFCALSVSADETPTMGWSSWNTYRIHISDELIRKQADAMKSTGLQAAGYKYINIDDGYFGGRDENGKLICHPEKFPNGMKAVADYIHSLGFKAGIYSEAGDNTCGSRYDKDPYGVGVGMYQHEEQDAELFFNEWGYDFIKIDYCGAQHLRLDEKEQYTRIRQAIDKAGRPDVRINICRWAFPGTWVSSVGSSWRIYKDITVRWSRIKEIIDANLYLSPYAINGHFNDMDMLEIGRGLKKNEEETHFGMWCIMSSPLLIGYDMTRIPEASLRLISNPELIALNQDPLCLQAKVMWREGELCILAKDLEELHGLTRAVALYNPTDEAKQMTLRFKDIGLDGKIKVRNVIEREDVTEFSPEEMTVEIPAHGVRIYKITGKKRLEAKRYEGENAWLETYQAIRNSGSRMIAKEGASGGYIAHYIGGRSERFMKWNDVYSQKGGSYQLTIRYTCSEARSLCLTVNGGTPIKLEQLHVKEGETFATCTLRIELKKGFNEIRIGNDHSQAPDIDYIELETINK